MANAMLQAERMVPDDPPRTFGPWRRAAYHLGFFFGHRCAMSELTSTAAGVREEARREARDDFERTVVVLREENSTLRRMLEVAGKRSDELLTELARSLVVQATPIPAPPSISRKTTSTNPIRGLENLLDPVDLGDPTGEFASERAASLMAAEDDDGAPTTAAA